MSLSVSDGIFSGTNKPPSSESPLIIASAERVFMLELRVLL
jgi:hypothetical protein